MDRNVSQQEVRGVTVLMAPVYRPRARSSAEPASILGAGSPTNYNLESSEEPVTQGLQI